MLETITFVEGSPSYAMEPVTGVSSPLGFFSAGEWKPFADGDFDDYLLCLRETTARVCEMAFQICAGGSPSRHTHFTAHLEDGRDVPVDPGGYVPYGTSFLYSQRSRVSAEMLRDAWSHSLCEIVRAHLRVITRLDLFFIETSCAETGDIWRTRRVGEIIPLIGEIEYLKILEEVRSELNFHQRVEYASPENWMRLPEVVGDGIGSTLR